MFRILLADDEGIMLESLKSIISSNFGSECEIVCVKTGRAVIEQAEAFRPDIAFVDIHMPGLSGIQAVREVRKFNSTTVFVIITAYDKFSYAQEAVNLGVMEFIMKPVSKKTILDVCARAMGQVEDARKKLQDDLRIREKLEIVVPMVESGFIYNILQDDSSLYTGSYVEMLDIRDSYGFMIIMEFGDSMEGGVMTNAVGVSVKAARFYPMFRELVKNYFDCITGPVMGNRIVLFVSSASDKTKYEERVDIITRVRNLVYKLESRIDMKFRAGIGTVKQMDEIRESYREALKALRESESHVIHITDIPQITDYDGEYPRDLEMKYLQRGAKGDTEGAMACASEFFDWMYSHCFDVRSNIEVKVLELVMRLEFKAFEDANIRYGFRYREGYLREVTGAADTEGLRAWFLDKTKEICQTVGTAKEVESKSVVSRVKAYIDENYSGDISLDEVSRMVDISPYYFSKLFKQEAGENFIEYLTKVRIEKACRFLEDPKYSIKEVCIMSGYGDPNYFSRIFKKYEVVTPSEYRER